MKLTIHQQQAFDRLRTFLQNDQDQVFILKGYAGTGKTTLVGQVAALLKKEDRPFQLLATTGRAAKVLQNKTGYTAATLHACIYTFDDVAGVSDAGDAAAGEQLQLHFNLRSNIFSHPKLVYIVDEASMISHEGAKAGHTARFGSGSLLHDLLAFADGRKIIFVGDPCQLPPIADNPLSSALSAGFLRSELGLPVDEVELTEIVRQQGGSEILRLAQPFRDDVRRGSFVNYPKVPAPGGRQAMLLPDDRELVRAYVDRIRGHRYHDAIMICHANWQVNRLNQHIRKALYPDWQLQERELLMIVQNSYSVDLANGDQVILERAAFDSKRAGFVFLKVRVRALHNDAVYETLLIRDLLYNNEAGLSREEVQRLLIDFDQRMRAKGIRRKSTAYKEAMFADPYLNALRAKFGYAVTCHKAQGGEWPHVYLNIYKSIYGMNGPALYRWYYTALTRAKEQLFLNDGWWVQGFDRRNPEAKRRFYKKK